MELNLNLGLNSFSFLLSPPNIDTNIVPDCVGAYCSITTTPGALTINWTLGSAIPANMFMVVQSSGVVSTGVSYPKNFKTIAILPPHLY